MHLNYELDIVKVLDSAFLGHRYDSPLLKTLSLHARIGGGRHRNMLTAVSCRQYCQVSEVP